MKVFVIPEVEVVSFSQKDIISTSVCRCVDCTICPPGKNNCTCYDFGGGLTNE